MKKITKVCKAAQGSIIKHTFLKKAFVSLSFCATKSKTEIFHVL